ncbi:cytochrome c3 family protein [Neobacillus sp. Marseille-QA0830]
MKRMNSKRKLISYVALWSIIIGSLLSYSPDTHVLSATGVPEITIDTPGADYVSDVSKVLFTGNISDDLTTSDKLLVKVFEQTEGSEQPTDITEQGQLLLPSSDKSKEFSYSKDFNEGVHKVSFIVTNEEGISSTPLEITFTVKQPAATQQVENASSTANAGTDLTELGTYATDTEAANPPAEEIGNRPYLKRMYLIPRGTEGRYNPETPDADIKDFLPAEDMTRVPLDSIILLDIRSKGEFNPDQVLISLFGNKEAGTEKLINPDSKPIEVSDGTKSYLYTFTPKGEMLAASSYFVYLNPNLVVPRFFKFTTVSTNYSKYQFDGDNDVRPKDYIHGPFSNVTNACAYCHSTHTGSTSTLEGGKYGTDTDDLCMACHDGTNGSPKLETNYATNKHTQDTSVSCSSCHNPHTPGTKDNPNSLHSALTYKKASTATGSADDYSLCLSCHNGVSDEESGQAFTNIAQYYKDEPYVSQSGHKITATADSGSQLDGQIPCAECHETHGAKNQKMLRENLGNVKIDDTQKLFATEGTEWNASNERNFCLSCHSSQTELYGTKATFSMTKKDGTPNTGHQDTKSQCSSCHGGTSKSFIEAAHAPAKLSDQTP